MLMSEWLLPLLRGDECFLPGDAMSVRSVVKPLGQVSLIAVGVAGSLVVAVGSRGHVLAQDLRVNFLLGLAAFLALVSAASP